MFRTLLPDAARGKNVVARDENLMATQRLQVKVAVLSVYASVVLTLRAVGFTADGGMKMYDNSVYAHLGVATPHRYGGVSRTLRPTPDRAVLPF